jgi:aminocarboxymuconate-semialdehyde decarboxylase
MTAAAILLDVHAHILPLRPGVFPPGEGIRWTEAGRLIVDGAELANAELYDPQALIAWMDRHGIGTAWVSVPPTLYRASLVADAALAWCRALNEALRAVAASHPERLGSMYHLPMQHPAVAAEVAAEATRAGQRRFAMPAGDPVGLRVLSDPAYLALWSALDAADAFLFLHPGRACDPRFDHFSLPNLLGGPTETAIAAAHLAMSGIVERHARITFCLAHGGGTLAASAGRLQRGQDTERAGAYLGGEKVRQALRRFCADCITHDAEALKLSGSVFGADHILFGSDWPFAMGLQDPRRQLDAAPAELKLRIFDDNGAALLRSHGDRVTQAEL